MAKKLVACVSAVGLAMALTPAAAFAADASAGSTDDGAYYTLPTTAAELDHSGTDADGNTYSYSYLSSGIERIVGGFSQSMYYIMGINGMNFDRGLRNKSGELSSTGDLYVWECVDTSTHILTASHVTAVDGIMGTAVNSQPDEYLWNSCVALSSATVLTDLKDTYLAKNNMVYMNPSNVKAFQTISADVTIDETTTEYAIPNVFYYEANFVSDADSGWASDASTDTYSYADHTINEWVTIEAARSGNDYDPYIGSWTTASGGINYGCELMYELADVVDAATEDSRDTYGNATLMSRYVDANGTDDTKYDSATSIAQIYEDFAKASQYYMIEQLAAGNTTSKTTAVICGYQPANDTYDEACYACRIYDPDTTGEDANAETAKYGSRLANSIMNFTTDINTLGLTEAFTAADSETNYVKWYTASDIVDNADAVFVTDVPYGNNKSDYLAENADGDRLSIYSVDQTSDYTTQNENIQPLLDAAEGTSAKADVYYKYPMHLFGVWYAQGFENNWLGPLAAAYLYPDVFPSVADTMAFAADKFWHINSSDVASVVEATCYNISMPSGTELGTPNDEYETNVQTVLDEGNAYYVSSNKVRSTINAMNTGDLVTYNLSALKARVGQAEKTASAKSDAEEAALETAAYQAIATYAASGSDTDYAAAETAIAACDSSVQSTLTAALTSVKSAIDSAASDTAKATAKAAAQLKTITLNKKTVKKSDIAKYSAATTVVLGSKVKKIAAKTFKGSKVKTVFIQSKKLKKASVKNCFKGSKVKTVQVPAKKLKAYKKIFKKKNSGKKVSVS